MITITGIFIYPLKSARGIALPEAHLSDRGIQHDRRFLLVDASGRFFTQRDDPRMALLHTAIVSDTLLLSFASKQLEVPLTPSAGDTRNVRVFSDEIAGALELPLASEFLGAAFGKELSLVYMPDGVRRQVDPTRAGPDDLVGFADGFPFLLTNESSLNALNVHLSDPVTMRRFRPNFVIEGADAYAEDHFTRLTLGSVPFLALKPCSRCVIVDTDPELGVRAPGPLAALAHTHTIGKRAIFGQNLVARGTGVVRMGDEVVVSPRD
ncbi:MAG TPA: MOSC N-terminal beta barrel domain-containing protein [Polyangiales bacterium]|nr:MOSC N-terminal beta barrel domain-containing protein [Polyangiales bacterium]